MKKKSKLKKSLEFNWKEIVAILLLFVLVTGYNSDWDFSDISFDWSSNSTDDTNTTRVLTEEEQFKRFQRLAVCAKIGETAWNETSNETYTITRPTEWGITCFNLDGRCLCVEAFK